MRRAFLDRVPAQPFQALHSDQDIRNELARAVPRLARASVPCRCNEDGFNRMKSGVRSMEDRR